MLLGVVWGNAKISNILIDEKEAWIVDFGGGQTLCWVDYELVGQQGGQRSQTGQGDDPTATATAELHKRDFG